MFKKGQGLEEGERKIKGKGGDFCRLKEKRFDTKGPTPFSHSR